MELRRTGFTIVELIVCITIMFMVVGAAIPMVFKKLPNPEDTYAHSDPRLSGTFVCPKEGTTLDECEIDLGNDSRREFVSITLVGGGAGGGMGNTKKGGGAGEGKIVFYPSLPAYDYETKQKIRYVIKLGAGGPVGQNGGQTTLYKVVNGKTQVLEYALGGIATNEEADQNDGVYNTSGKVSSLGKFNGGKGGDANQAGTMGEAIVEW